MKNPLKKGRNTNAEPYAPAKFREETPEIKSTKGCHFTAKNNSKTTTDWPKARIKRPLPKWAAADKTLFMVMPRGKKSRAKQQGKHHNQTPAQHSRHDTTSWLGWASAGLAMPSGQSWPSGQSPAIFLIASSKRPTFKSAPETNCSYLVPDENSRVDTRDSDSPLACA
jgi:hypothetical protein